MKIRTLNMLFAATISVALLSNNAFALDCPTPQTGAEAGTLPQSAKDISETSTRLAFGTTGNAVNEVIFDLRKKYPKANEEEIINYLITAYCPVVARKTGLSADQATDELKQFSAQVRSLVEN